MTQLYQYGDSPQTIAQPITPLVWRALTVGLAAESVTLSGDTLIHYGPSRWEWTVSWQHLNAAQKDTIMTELARTVPLAWQPPDDATTYKVVALPDSVRLTQSNQGWDISVTLRGTG